MDLKSFKVQSLLRWSSASLRKLDPKEKNEATCILCCGHHPRRINPGLLTESTTIVTTLAGSRSWVLGCNLRKKNTATNNVTNKQNVLLRQINKLTFFGRKALDGAHLDGLVD